MKKPLLIVGLDPGTTIGITLIDIQGNIVYAGSKRDLGLSESINIITSKGIPLCIGTDKAKLPGTIKSISTNMGIKAYSPKEDMTSEEKKDIILKYEKKNSTKIKYSNAHEYDSICCALYAYMKSKKLLSKLNEKISHIDEKNRIEFYRRAFSEDIPIHRLINEFNNEQGTEKNPVKTVKRIKKEHENVSTKKNNEDENIHRIIKAFQEKLNEKQRTIKVYETKIEVLRKRMKSMEKKDRKKLQYENRSAKENDENNKRLEETDNILKKIISGNADILHVSNAIYEKKHEKPDLHSKNEYKIIFNNKKYDIEGYKITKKVTEEEKHIKNTKVNLSDILEEHKLLRRIAKENERKNTK